MISQSKTNVLTLDMIEQAKKIMGDYGYDPFTPAPIAIDGHIYFWRRLGCYRSKWPAPKWATYLESKGFGVDFGAWGMERMPQYDKLDEGRAI